MNNNARSVLYSFLIAIWSLAVIWSCWWTDRRSSRVHSEVLLFTILFTSFSYCFRLFIISTKRCPTDSTLDYSYNPTRHYQQFKIRALRFRNDYDTVYFHCELLACHRNYPDSRLVSNYSVTLQTSQSELPQLDFRELMILLGVTAKCLCRFCFFLFGCYQIREMLPQEISHLICVVWLMNSVNDKVLFLVSI